MNPFVCLPIGYLIGSIPTGIWLCKAVAGTDPRTVGSGSSGATNVSRILGKKWAAGVLFVDVLKGYLPVKFLAPALVPINSSQAMVLMAVGCIVGHVWTLYAGFRGGKGVGTAAGAWIALDSLAFGIAGLIWAVVFASFRVVSLASIIAACGLAVAVGVRASISSSLFAFGLATALFITYTHRENIKRLLTREERRLI